MSRCFRAGLILLVGTLLCDLSRADGGVSDSDFVYLNPNEVFEAIPPFFGDLRRVQAVMVHHRSPILTLTIPLSYSNTTGNPEFLDELMLDSTVVTAPGAWGVSFGPGGHDSLWTSRLVDVDNIGRTILLRFATSTPISPETVDTLCVLHWLVPNASQLFAFGFADIDTAEVSGQHLEITGPTDTLTPVWQKGSFVYGAVDPMRVREAADHGPRNLFLGIYPNPFNSQTRIQFALRTPEQTAFTVYSILGQRVRHWPAQRRSAGRHELLWDGRDEQGRTVASGVYYFVLETETARSTSVGVMLK